MGQIEQFEGRLSVLKSFYKQSPSSLICSLGFACALATWFPGRLGLVRNFISESKELLGFTDLVAVAFLVVMAIVWTRKPGFRFSHSEKLVGLWGGGAMTLLFFVQFCPIPCPFDVPDAGVACIECLYKLASCFLLLLWIEQADRFSGRFVMISLGTGCFMLALFEFLVLGLRSSLSQFLFVLLPAMSLFALFAYPRFRGALPYGETPCCGRNETGKPHMAFPIATLCLGILVFALAGSSIQSYVTHANLTPVSMTLFGFFDAVGLILTAAVLVGTAVSTHQRASMFAALLIMPSILALAYVLSIVAPQSEAHLAYMPLAMARRLTIVFWLIAVVVCPQRFKVAAVAALATYRFAQTLGNMSLLNGAFDYLSTTYSLIVVGELAVAVAICPLIAYVCLRRMESPLGEGQEPAFESEPLKPGADPRSADRADSHQAALDSISSRYGLSNREKDVFALLAEGWRAATIAEKLVLSPATIKNHMNSIYGKLGVHSQDELLCLVESVKTGV